MANAIGMIELSSIARGIITADAMLKAGQVDMITASSTCPGKYIAIVHGEVAAVEASMAAGITTAGTFWSIKLPLPMCMMAYTLL